jgi:hypothetical protein
LTEFKKPTKAFFLHRLTDDQRDALNALHFFLCVQVLLLQVPLLILDVFLLKVERWLG